MQLNNQLFKSNSICVAMLVLCASVLAACATVGERKAQYAEASYAQGDYDTAFDMGYESLVADAWNDRPIRLFPDLVLQVRRLHEQRIRANEGRDWDTVARSYDRLKLVNERLSTIQQWHQAERAQGGKRFSRKVTEADLARIASLPQTALEPGFGQAHQHAAQGHYDRAKGLAATQNYRQAVAEFRAAKGFVPNFRDAQMLALSNEQLANKKDAGIAYAQGSSFAAAQQYRQAQHAFESALSFVPNYRDARALVQRYKNLADQADAETRYVTAMNHAQRGEYRLAAEAFAAAMTFVPGYKDAAQQQQRYMQMANEQEAGEFYEQGLTFMVEQNYAAAEQAFNQANQRVPGYKDAARRARQAHDAIPPQAYEIKRAIAEALSHSVPLAWLNVRHGHTEKVQLSKLDIEWLGSYDMRHQRWPVTVEVAGSCELEQRGREDQHLNFEQTATFNLERFGSQLKARIAYHDD